MVHRRLRFEPIHPRAGSSFFYDSFRPAHFSFTWHQHPELELALVDRGRGERYVGDSIEAFGPGDLVLLGSDLPHTWHTDPGDGPVHSHVVQFLPTVFGDVVGETPELKPIAALLRRADRGLRPTGKTRDEAERLFRRIHADRGRTWRQVCDLIALLGTMAESGDLVELSGAVPRAGADARAGEKVDRVFALLHRAPDQIPTQAQAARALGMSPPAFSRFFRNAVGRTYVACVNEIRVLAACRDLIETDRPVIDIAYTAGFANLSNFNRRFRAQEGVTPSAYRRQRRRAQAKDD